MMMISMNGRLLHGVAHIKRMSFDLFNFAPGDNITDLISRFHKILAALIGIKLNITITLDHLLIFPFS